MEPTLRMRTNPIPDTAVWLTSAVSVWGYWAEHIPSSTSSACYCYHPHQHASGEKWKNTLQFIVTFTCQGTLKQFATGPCLPRSCWWKCMVPEKLKVIPVRVTSPISKPTSTQVPFPLPDLDDQTVQIHDANIQQNKKKQLTTGLINSLTILNSQPQRLPCLQPNMHSQEGGTTTRASV